MLAKDQRINTADDFRFVMRTGAKSGGRCMVIYRVSDPSLRAGFIVSKKVGNAVVRNKVKRRLRSIVAQADLSGLIVVRALPGAAVARFADLQTEFLALVQKVTGR